MNAKGWLQLILAIGAGFACGLWLSVHYPLSPPATTPVATSTTPIAPPRNDNPLPLTPTGTTTATSTAQ
jgi:hypothetical protein